MGRPRKGESVRILKTFRIDPDTIKKIDELKKGTGKSRGEIIDEKFVDTPLKKGKK